MAFSHTTNSPPWQFIGTDDRYSAKTRTGTKQILHDRQISASKGQFDLVFPRGKREKRLYCVVWFTSAESYGFGKGVERKQKGPSPPAAFVMKQPPLDLLTSLPAPLNPSEQREHRRSCTHRDTVHLRQTLWDTSDVGYGIYRRRWLDRMHLITRVFLRPGWVHRLRWDPAHEFRADPRGGTRPGSDNDSVLWDSYHPASLS